MKRLKKSISLLSIIILIIGVSGCMKQENKVTKDSAGLKITTDSEEIKDQIIGFLEEKYDKEFTPGGFVEENTRLASRNTLMVYPKGGDKQKELFEAYREMKDDKYEFSDSYFGVLIHDEYVEKIRGIAKEFFPQCVVEVNNTTDSLPNELDLNSTLQDVLDMNVEYDPVISLNVAPTFNSIEEFDKNVDLFIPKLIENKMKGNIVVHYFNNDNLNVDIVENRFVQKRKSFYINSDFKIKEFK